MQAGRRSIHGWRENRDELKSNEVVEEVEVMTYEGFAKLEKEGWTSREISNGYIDLFASASDLAIPDLITEIPSGARVLDLCCGQGNVSEALKANGFRFVGADFSPVMLEHARRRTPRTSCSPTENLMLSFATSASCTFPTNRAPSPK